MILHFLQLAFGFALLLVGGNLLVRGAISIAVRFGLPSLLVGLTIVAWGTSAPEFAFNVISATKGKTDLVFGNIVGANLCNLGPVLAVSTFIRPLRIHASVIKYELPLLMILIPGFALLALLPWNTLDWQAGGGFSRVDGAIILVGFAGFSIWMIRRGLQSKPADASLKHDINTSPALEQPISLWLAIVFIIISIALLGFGGDQAASAAGNIALGLGVPEKIVGVTIVSIGTTMPEMVTNIVATRKGQVDLAIGNVVGSCLFNIGFIYAICTMITPGSVPEGGMVSIGVMCLLVMMVLPLAWWWKSHLGKTAGIALLVVYCSYLAYEAVQAFGGR